MNIKTYLGKGTKDILILTGVHGDELTPIYVGYKLDPEKQFDINSYRLITIVSAINIEGIKKGVREIPSDHTTDLNRMFINNIPENKVNEIKKLINTHDIVIDLHSSPSCTEFILINQNEYANSYVEFAISNNIKYLLRYSDNNTIKKYCIERNKISFTVEINKMKEIDFDSSFNCQKLLERIINNINSFKQNKDEPIYKTYQSIYTHKEGMFIPHVGFGNKITNGTRLGEIINLKTFESSYIEYNGDDGIIICDSGSSYVTPNNPIFDIQPIN